MSRIYSWLFGLAWPVVRRHLEESTVTSCWLEAWIRVRNERHGVADSRRVAASVFLRAIEDHQ